MLTTNANVALEKNFCVLIRYQKEFTEVEDYFTKEFKIDKIKDYKYPKKFNHSINTTLNKGGNTPENLNFLSKNFRSTNFSYHQSSLENSFSNIEFIYEKDNFISTNFNELITIRRRKRRKFASEEERRVARILKNRRTAEESRQRRIHKMKTLENFVSISEEREKKFKEELRSIGIQSAFRMVELILMRKQGFL
jgi:hypothetical protein